MSVSKTIKKVYYTIAEAIYNITSKKGIMNMIELYDTPTMTKYHHIVSALRYVVVEEYYGMNEFGKELYIKANPWDSQKAMKDDLDRFDNLIHSIEVNGYDMNSTIDVDLGGNCFNGTHRLALCVWFGVEQIPVKIIKRHLKCKTIQEMREYYHLSEEEFQLLENAYQRMRTRLNKTERS